MSTEVGQFAVGNGSLSRVRPDGRLTALRHDRALTENYEARVIEALAVAGEANDPPRPDDRLARYSRVLGEVLNLHPHDLEMLVLGARLHDMRKLGIGEALATKSARFLDDEWVEMKLDAELGTVVRAPLAVAKEMGPILQCHHDRWDGNGNLDGLAGRKIPRLARILSVVDAFACMTSERPYRPALPVGQAVVVLEDGSARQWDPEVVEAWLDLLEQNAVSGLGPISPQALAA
jgi:response regulator RpfG family c-di-GMP phosphodiesterase